MDAAKDLEAQKTNLLSLVEKEVQDLLAKKKALDRQLAVIETNIYTYEGSYLDDPNGNIVKGYDGYINATTRETKSLAASSSARKVKVLEQDRIFSLSSKTYQKSMTKRNDFDR